jgi:formylglycine-generating enzyme required for sulfatase activity
MLLASNIKIAMIGAAALAGPLAISTPSLDETARVNVPALVTLQPGTRAYRAAGDFTRAGRPAEAPLVTAHIAHQFSIMATQVTASDYQRCVDAKGCKALASDVTTRPDHPAVQVSWHDAQAYAAWLSRETGVTYRLPTDEEWAYAAGSRWRDDGVSVDANDPSRRALARYERETELKEDAAVDGAARPIGSFGTNENGLLDVSGNVWEWTATCFVRTALDAAAPAPVANCGVRVVEGRHRAYVTDFIRDARAGGCAAGTPPANLGFRLVMDGRSGTSPLASVIRALRALKDRTRV